MAAGGDYAPVLLYESRDVVFPVRAGNPLDADATRRDPRPAVDAGAAVSACRLPVPLLPPGQILGQQAPEALDAWMPPSIFASQGERTATTGSSTPQTHAVSDPWEPPPFFPLPVALRSESGR